MKADLRHCRSLLFLPASNPRAIGKARGLAADMVVLDLEDAVKPEDKRAARAAAVEAAAEGFPGLCAIRINSSDPWHEADLEAVTASRADYVVVPMTPGPEPVREAAEATGKPVLAMIETARGVLAAAAIAPATAGLIAGTNDLAADLGLRPGGDRAALATALQTILLAARAAGVAAFDGVYNRLDDPDGFAAAMRRGTLLRLRRQVADPSRPDRDRQPPVRTRPPRRSRRRGGCSPRPPAAPSASRGR